MKRLVLCAVVLVLSTPAFADGGFTGYSWPGWRLSSSELTNSDMGENNVRDGRVAFPLSQLVDDDPTTTWVYYEASDATKKRFYKYKSRKNVVRSVTLNSEKPIVADALWLMNGYNRRADLFTRNDRVVRIRIHCDGKPVKDVNLADTMGWHKIALPRRKFSSITIELTGIRKGTGPDNDICLSELALYSRRQKIDFHLPRALVYSRFACCGGTGHLITRSGHVIAEGDLGEGADVEWSADGRRVAGIMNYWRRGNMQVWIADASAARVVRRVYFRKNNPDAIEWLNNRTLQVEGYSPQNKRTVTVDIHSPV